MNGHDPAKPQEFISGRYVVTRTLVEHGCRRVYRCRDRLLGLEVVVKGALVSGLESPEAQAVIEEFQRLRRCRHPRIARAWDFGVASSGRDGDPVLVYFTQEWLEGQPVRYREDAGEETLLARLVELLEIVAFLHHLRIVRLDLKPDHLLVGRTGIRLIDLDQARTDAPFARGEPAGTLAYLAPELLAGDPGSPRSDLYSVGAILYELLTGSAPPVKGRTLEEVHDRLVRSPVPRVPGFARRRAPRLAALTEQLLQRDPSSRPAGAETVLESLGYPCGSWRRRAPLPVPPWTGAERLDELAERVGRRLVDEQGGALAFTGPSGAGGTRLLEELADWWQLRGTPVLRFPGTWCPGSAQPVLRTIRRFLQGVAGVGSENDAPAPVDSDSPGGGPGRVVRDEVAGLLEAARVACERTHSPFAAVLLDDPEALDFLTRQVFVRVGAHLPGSGLVLVIAGRGAEELVAEAQGWSKLPLDPLDLQAIRHLAEETLGDARGVLSPEEVKALASSSGGLPGPIMEALEARWHDAAFDFSTWAPSGWTARAEALIETLEPSCREVLQVLSLFERGVEVDVLETLVPGCSACMSELVERGVVMVLEMAGGGFPAVHVSNEALRKALTETLDSAVRGMWHRRAAEVLEQRYLLEKAAAPWEVARHFLLAGAGARARPYLHLAVEEAVKTSSLEEATRALAHLVALENGPSPQRAELFRRLGDLHLALERYAEAREAFSSALSEVPNRDRTRRAQCMGGLARALSHLEVPDEAATLLESALSLAGSDPAIPGEEKADWLLSLAWIYLEREALDEAETCLDRVALLALPVSVPQGLEEARLRAHLGLKRGASPSSLTTGLERALERAGTSGLDRERMRLHNTLADLYHRSGDTEHMDAHLQAVLELARRSYDIHVEALASHNLAFSLRERGRPEKALPHFERAATLFARMGNTVREVYERLSAVHILLDHGQVTRAEPGLKQVEERLARLEPTPELEVARLTHRLLSARLARLRGHTRGLSVEVDTLVAAFARTGHNELTLEAYKERMALDLQAGRPDEALDTFRRARETCGMGDQSPGWRDLHALAIRAHLEIAPGAGEGLVVAREAGSGGSVDSSVPDNRSSVVAAKRGGPEKGEDGARAIPVEPVGRRVDVATWASYIGRLAAVADEAEPLAAELAALVGEMLDGRGLVVVWEEGRPQVARSHRLDEEQVRDVSYSVIERVRRTRKPYVCPDVRVDRELSGMRSIRASAVASLVCYPVVKDGVCLGVIYVDHREPGLLSDGPALSVIEQVAGFTGELIEAIQRRRKVESLDPEASELVGTSAPMRALKERIAELAAARDPDLVVLLLGETGTGKSMVAREIWRLGSRSGKPFYPVNCAAIERNLFSSQMFGHVRGAFTGAHQAQAGWLELSAGGVLFLDEVGEIPLEEQAALLRVLQERRFYRLGDPSRELVFDAQLILATNRDLRAMVAEGTFREDLLRRIHVNVCRLPSLRECGAEDIGLLASHAIKRYLMAQGLAKADDPVVWEDFVTRSAATFLTSYDWPWNVGELENFFRNEVVRRHLRSLGKEKIDVRVAEEVLGRRRPPVSSSPGAQDDSVAIPEGLTIKELADWWNKARARYVQRLHEACGGNVSETARRLQCTRDMVYKYLRVAKEGG